MPLEQISRLEQGLGDYKQIEYTDEPLGELNIVPYFLPLPEELVFKEENVEVTKKIISPIDKMNLTKL
jgi:hypothetical protein